MRLIPTIETPRLLLRPPAASDLEDLVALGADPEVMRYLGQGQTQTRAEATHWLEALLREVQEGVPGPPGLPGWLVLTTRPSGAWAGLAVLRQMNARHAQAIGGGPYVEVGYRLAQAHWGKGYATEAAAALVRHGFGTLQLPLITAIAQAQNVASNRVIQKIGLHFQKTYSLDGRVINLHSLTRAASGAG